MTVRARLLALAAAALFSTGGAAIKATSLTGWQVASFRSGVAAATLVLLLPAARGRWSPATLLVASTYAATLILFVLANKLTSSASAIFLQGTAPLWVLVAAPLLLREPIRRRDVWFMLAIAFGLACFFQGRPVTLATAPDPVRGNVAGALSGVAWAATVIGLRWLSTRSAGGSLLPAVVAGNLAACVLALPGALPVASMGVTDVLIIGFLGVFQIGLAYYCLTSAVAHLPALEITLLLLLEPVMNPVWAWAVHGEDPGGWALAGGAVIVGATAVRTLGDRA